MCGIYATNLLISENKVRTKIESIGFRGPDFLGIKNVFGVTLGHLRLAILDLNDRSNQPMEYQGLYLVFNGEIYNYKELRENLISLGYSFETSGDSEVLLIGYKKWGRSILKKLNGMFSFVIFDSINNIIFAARDRLGVKPFYYSWKDGFFEICSQLRPICENRTINEAAISMYLDCTYIPSPHTIYNEVYKLEPGSFLEIDLNNTTIFLDKYWDLQEVIFTNLSFQEAKNQVHELLKNAVKIRLDSDVPFGSFLSGGIDSALVTAIASKISLERINTFSIGFKDSEYDESKIAAEFSKFLGTNHHEIICTPFEISQMISKLVQVYDEPFGDSSALPSLLLNKVSKQFVTVALSGDGGDESFLGYNHFDWISNLIIFNKIPVFARNLLSKVLFKYMFGKRTETYKRILSIKNLFEFVDGIFVGFNSLLKVRDLSWLNIYKKYQILSKNIFQQTADLNIKLWLENDSNVKVDRASMAYSLEVRSPFLDYRIIEFSRNLPVSFRYKVGQKKRLLREILKEYLPEELFNHPKKGFSVPIGSWMRNELKEEFISNLTEDFLNIVPNLDVKKFSIMFEDHMRGKADHSSYIWRVYILSKWYQEFGYYQKTIQIEKRKKVFFVIPSLKAGGAERIIAFLSQNFDKMKFDLKLIVIGHKCDTVFDVQNVEVVYFNKDSIRYSLKSLYMQINNDKPDFVMGTIGHVNLMLGFFSFIFRKTKFVCRVSSLVSKSDFIFRFPTVDKFICRYFYKRFSVIVCQSIQMKDDFVNFFDFNFPQITIINNPITSLENFEKKSEGFTKLSFITVGRLEYNKGHLRILNVLSKIKSYEFTYTIVGSGSLDKLLKERVIQLGLENKVDFVSHTTQILKIVNEKDYFIQGSYFEGFPNVILESCSVGTPIIAFDAPGGTREIVQDCVNGFIVETEFELEQLLNDVNKLKSINSTEVKNSVYEKFDSRKILDQYESIFSN